MVKHHKMGVIWKTYSELELESAISKPLLTLLLASGLHRYQECGISDSQRKTDVLCADFCQDVRSAKS